MWHEARRSEKKVHEIMDAARRRAQKRAIFLAKRRVDPQQTLRVVGTRCRVHHDATIYQATEDQQGLIPWNGKEDNLIDRFDGRALLDMIREYSAASSQPREKTEEEEELEEMVNFQRYRDLIKQRRRGLSDKQGLEDVEQELEARSMAPFPGDKQRTPAVKPTYAQVGFAYETAGGSGMKEEAQIAGLGDSDSDEEGGGEEEEGSSSEDSEDELIESIGQDYGVQRFNALLSLDRKLKEEEGRQKELVKGDPAMRKLSRKERRKVSQQEREREKEAARLLNNRPAQHDPYRELRKSPTYDSYSHSYPRRERGRTSSLSPPNSRSRIDHRHGDSSDPYDRDHHSRKKKSSSGTTSTIEYITEFGVEGTAGELERSVAPPSSPPTHMVDVSLPSRRILEALHSDPAAVAVAPAVAGASGGDWDARHREREARTSGVSSSSAIAKLSKLVTTPGSATQKTSQADPKTQETPQERLKRIMNKQLSKQIKKDTVSEAGKRREQERERQEKLAETRRIAQRSRRGRSRSHSRSLSPVRYRYRSRSRSPIRSYPRSPRSRSRVRS